MVARKDADGSRFYYHPDHLGSTTLVTNQTGAAVENTNYEPFGKPLYDANSRFLYTGKELDSESHLMYYGARYYNPEIMRFVQPDSIIQNIYNPQALNRYSYVVNNPYKYVDSTGHIYGVLADLIASAGQYAFQASVYLVANFGEDIPFIALSGAMYALDRSSENWDVFQTNVMMSFALYSGATAAERTSARINSYLKTGTKLEQAVCYQERSAEILKAGGTADDLSLARITPIQKQEFNVPSKFASENKLTSHYNSHGLDYGPVSESGYNMKSSSFMNSKFDINTFEYIRPGNGDYVRYNLRTNDFGIRTKDNIQRSFFKPENALAYFLKDYRKNVKG